MIEIICKDEPEKEHPNDGEETVFLPKNIRQVGSPRGRHKVYLEDYVYTYLRSISKNNERCAAVFLGKSRVVKDIRYTFISGVVECTEAVFQWENICLDESFWDYIYKEQKRFFSELDIVGWVLGKAGQAMELTTVVEAAHRKYFAGRDKILMLIDILEREELFFIYEQGYLQKREGYYIYYEKNLAMQEYMIYKREEEMRLAELRYSELASQKPVQQTAEAAKAAELTEAVEQDKTAVEQAAEDIEEPAGEPVIRSEQFEDAKPVPKEPKTQAEEALETYRRMLLERQEKKEERQNRRFLYTASSFFLVVLCVIGITTINNYRKMQEVEDVLNVMNHKSRLSKELGLDMADEEADLDEGEPLVVETVESKIEPLEKDGKGQEKQGGADDTGNKSDVGNPNHLDEVKDTQEAGNEADGNPEEAGNEADGNPEEADGKAEEPSDREAEGSNQDSSDKATDNAQGSDSGAQNESQETAVGEQPEEKKYYTVQPGDTLNTICLDIYKSKDMVQKLKEINGIEDGDRILVGQKLLLP